MPNWSYTTVTLSGPDAEIERFKEACTFTEPTEGRDGIDFERVIPMPKVDWPECSSSVDTALVVLGRPELHVCFGGSEKTVDDLIERALKICADPPEPFFPGEAAFSLDGYHLGFVQQLRIRDADTFKAEYIKRYPDEIAQARLAINAHEQTGFANSLDWACKNWGTKWHPRISTFDGIDERGCQRFYLVTAWSPPVPLFEKIVALFPALALKVYSSDEMGNYFVKGTISASGTDLSDDKEAMAKWEAMMNEPPPRPGAVTTTTSPARTP